MPNDWFLEEYKLIQGKIDKVLESQFQVRSWSVSLLTGFVLGIFATRVSPLTLLFALPVVGMFHLQDIRQKWFRKTLSNRASNLESGINLLGLPIADFSVDQTKKWAGLRRSVPKLGAVPGAARGLAYEKAQLNWFLRHAERFFWLTQYAVVLVIVSPYLIEKYGNHVVVSFRWLIRFFGNLCR